MYFIDKIWSLLLEMSPFLLFGFIVSGFLSVLLTVEIVLGGEFGNMSSWEIIQQEILNESCITCHIEGEFYAEQSGLILTDDIADDDPLSKANTEASLMRASSSATLLSIVSISLFVLE